MTRKSGSGESSSFEKWDGTAKKGSKVTARRSTRMSPRQRRLFGERPAHPDDGHIPELVDEPDYSNPETFIIRASDLNGHSEKLTLRMQPIYFNALGAAVATRRFGSVQGAILWCVHEGLRKLQQIDPSIPNDLSMIEAMNRKLARSEITRTFQKLIDDTKNEVMQLMAMQEYQEAARLAHSLLLDARRVANPHWRERYIKEIQSQFGGLSGGGRIDFSLPEGVGEGERPTLHLVVDNDDHVVLDDYGSNETCDLEEV